MWGSTETENRVHKYNVALFTLYFKEAMSSQRLNPTCINAVPTNAASSTCSNVDQEFWGKFGEDMMNQAYGLFRLSCETTIFESYPLFRTKRTIPSHALRDINGVLSAVDHEGPPVYLVPIIPTSTASTTRELHVLDHALYDILRSKVQMNDNAQYYSTNDSGAFTKLTLALILQYTQPLPQLSTDSAARAPHALTHRILSPAALRKCALEALPPPHQPLHPPVALAHKLARAHAHRHSTAATLAGAVHPPSVGSTQSLLDVALTAFPAKPLHGSVSHAVLRSSPVSRQASLLPLVDAQSVSQGSRECVGLALDLGAAPEAYVASPARDTVSSALSPASVCGVALGAVAAPGRGGGAGKSHSCRVSQRHRVSLRHRPGHGGLARA